MKCPSACLWVIVYVCATQLASAAIARDHCTARPKRHSIYGQNAQNSMPIEPVAKPMAVQRAWSPSAAKTWRSTKGGVTSKRICVGLCRKSRTLLRSV
eukprot:CAMPEP_0117595940 /NCGR_PEP_ID=MMETSP0784-20121206/74034_1 /TAXON_ID=39447 /ORGANISM="" /LENGTH=97 /DNA_ID=CAMNT_0005398163 /DNA_START=96 /DNA_END=389 /DNA_ORIENTATION=-